MALAEKICRSGRHRYVPIDRANKAGCRLLRDDITALSRAAEYIRRKGVMSDVVG